MKIRKTQIEQVVNPYGESSIQIDQEYEDDVPGIFVHGCWNDRILSFIKKNNIKGLYLNYARGWSGNDFSFLSKIPNLELLDIVNTPVKSLSVINNLIPLKSLSISCHWEEKIDLSHLKNLERCFISHGSGAETVFSCPNLRYLYIDTFKLESFDGLQKLEKLEYLTIGNSNFEDLSILNELKFLRKLVILNCRRLSALTGINLSSTLEWLTIDGSRKMSNMEPIETLSNLKVLNLSNNGKLVSIEPVVHLKNLEVFSFYGDTNILDGNLEPIEKLDNLSLLGFANRRHYTHKIERPWNWNDYQKCSNPLIKKGHNN
jgi:hypothetical protein